MKKFYFLLLLLVATLSAQAKNPISYRFGVDAGMVGNGYGFTISPILLQVSPSFQVGALGIVFHNYRFQSDLNDVTSAFYTDAESWSSQPTITEIGLSKDNNFYANCAWQLISIKYSACKHKVAHKFVPFIKFSALVGAEDDISQPVKNSAGINVSNPESTVPSRLFGDIKIGLSLYSKHSGSDLSAYIGAICGSYTVVNNDYDVCYTINKNGIIKDEDTRFWDFGAVQLPMQFTFGLQFEFGGKGAWGYGKLANCTTEQRKELRKQRTNNALSALSALGAGLNAAGEAYGAVSNNKNSGGSSQSQYGSSTSSSGKSQSYYQTQYDRWEDVAERHYNTIKQNGISTQRKKLYNEAQDEMKKIRQQAAKDGFTIAQSSWERINL